MRIVIIIPTYNEAGGIGLVLDELYDVCSLMPFHEWVVLVVDANSTDTTREIVREKQYPTLTVRLLEEEKKTGIARAYLLGIAYAKEKLHADAFVEFDGDGQHSPKDLQHLVHAFDQGADYVIGSRYVDGGSVPPGWAYYRKFLSRFGSLYARLLLELPVHDVTSGFKITRVQGFAHLLPQHHSELLSNDYAYKIQFLARMVESGARITEVPIVFRERIKDTSKSTFKDIMESLRVTAVLRLKRLRQWRLLRVVLVGGIGFCIQTVIFELLGIQGILSPSMAAVIGGECAVLSNFFLNELFSFTDRIPSPSSQSVRLVTFHLVSSASLLIQWLFLSIVERLTGDLILLRITYLVGIGVGFLVNYAGYYFLVWHKDVKK